MSTRPGRLLPFLALIASTLAAPAPAAPPSVFATKALRVELTGTEDAL